MKPDALPRIGPYTSLVSRVLFPLHESIKKHNSVALRKEMEISQWWSAHQIEELQKKRLRQLLAHAQNHVPYYRSLFAEHQIKVENIASVADLAQLPLLDKEKVRANMEALKSDMAKDIALFSTGGSTGEPLRFYIGKERVSHDVAAKWRATRWWGVDIGDPEIVIWGSPIELGAQDRVRTQRDRVLRTKLLPAFEMAEPQLNSLLGEIRAKRPKMLFGYPSVLDHIARHAETRQLRMDDLGIRVAFVTSECLSKEQRQQIARTFGCPVANGYGGRDAGFIAHECSAGGMHISAEDVIVEVVDTQGRRLPPGEAGAIVVTHLATSDFPFIRYRTGDIGVLDTELCSCGRGLPLLKEIQGRNTDFLVTQDGTAMHSAALVYLLRDVPQISAFKIIQENLSLTRILIVSKGGLPLNIKRKIESGCRARLGHNVNIAIEEVAEILPEKSGKFRSAISKIAPG